MRHCLPIILLSVAPLAHSADLIARQGNDWVRAYDEPCNHVETMIHIDRLGLPRDEFRKARAEFRGQAFYACWRQQGNLLHFVYEDGDQGIVPADEMKPVQDI